MPYKRIKILAALLLFAAPWLPGQQSLPVSPTLLERPVCPDIGSRLELFVDYYLIDGLKGTRLKLHHPRRAEVILRGDRPWEGEHGFGQDVLLDDGKYHLYYHSGGRMCYAESPDGVRWTKPSLGLIQYDGSRENNLVGTAEGEELYDHETEPSARFFLDRRPGVPAGECFKALKLNEGERANPTEKELARKVTLERSGFLGGRPDRRDRLCLRRWQGVEKATRRADPEEQHPRKV